MDWRKFWPVGLAVALFGAIGLANALKSPPGQSLAAVEAQAQLDRLPAKIGPWVGVPTVVPPKQLQIAEAQAHLSRAFTHERTKAVISVLILFGEPGALGAHTPETCYEGAGFRQVANPVVKRVPGQSAELWTTRFETGAFPATTVQVDWGWGAGGVWKASENPRLDFAGQRLIYKLYASRAVPPGAERPARDADPADELLAPLLTALRDGPAPAGP